MKYDTNYNDLPRIRCAKGKPPKNIYKIKVAETPPQNKNKITSGHHAQKRMLER